MNARIDKLLGNPHLEDRRNAESEMLKMSKPSIWNIHLPQNAELEFMTGFESFMYSVAENTTEDLDKITVFRFYSLLDHIKEKNKNG